MSWRIEPVHQAQQENRKRYNVVVAYSMKIVRAFDLEAFPKKAQVRKLAQSGFSTTK
jgi:hypothetical protein